MDHRLVPENSSSVAVYTVSNTILSEVKKCLNTRLRHLLNRYGTEVKGAKD